jgi:hypothetical protein
MIAPTNSRRSIMPTKADLTIHRAERKHDQVAMKLASIILA